MTKPTPRAAILTAAILILAQGATYGQSQERPLTNSDVVQMAGAGLSDDVIIRKIRYTESTFSLTPDELIVLKASGVSEPVLMAMLDKQNLRRALASLPGASASGSTPAGGEATRESKKNCWAVAAFPEKSRVVFVVMEDVNIAQKRIGDVFWLQAYKGLDAAAGRLIPAGAQIQGLVTHVQRPARGFRESTVRWVFTRMVLPNGYETQLLPNETRLRFWDFEKDKTTGEPKNRLPAKALELLATVSPGQALPLANPPSKSIYGSAAYYAGTPLSWAEPIYKNPQEGLLAGTGIVFQFKRLTVPLPEN